jgi:substrate import-associated zinc metallohydrolase lipoprotein
MKKILLLAGAVIALAACAKDNPDTSNSIFDTSSPERNSFDQWLMENYTVPYNIQVLYKMRDIETSYTYNVVPADVHKAKQMAFILKYLWLEPFETVADDGVHFIRGTVPRVFHYMGSALFDTGSHTRILGSAEGGAKITVTEVNDLNPAIFISQEFLTTIHHEYGHILHQTKPYDVEFQTITMSDYSPSGWHNRSAQTAAQMGFISPYAGCMPSEDFVELLARYLAWPDAQWEARLELAGETGRPIIEKKFAIVKAYMQSVWGVDLDALKIEVQNRAEDLKQMDLDNLGF